MRNLLLLLLALGMLAGCVDSRCDHGQVYKRERTGDGLWRESPGDKCVNLFDADLSKVKP